ncbi:MULTISPECIES: prepilin peptidase [unclassified Variovorax]|jgi:prepilin peptidase CpaA|uniref:A24 family peptidase n=1 Tax=unclassified Variovorax TaxID=663243 RepID=UPI0008CC5EE0|nr:MULTISPECIES: A24 family peptidase [unclassified Variovorax]SEK16485.1 prepilin peptidase CpaA [Variovorax sp. OK202]SFE49222.1 prepilin peptidase CpaA [Variovorax sp. OK212]
MRELDALLELLAMLATDVRTLALFALLGVAAVSDWRSYRIPNWLTFGGALFALVYGTLAARTPAAGAASAFGGLAVGFASMLVFYAVGIMGAGDVKLMAMAGAFLGPQQTLMAVLFTFIAGGVAALAFAIHRRRLGHMLDNVKTAAQGMAISTMAGIRPDGSLHVNQSVGKLPYGLCIGAGTAVEVLAHQLGYV